MTTLFAPLTVEDVASLLPGLSVRVLREVLVKHGCCSKIGRKLYVSLEQFERLLQVTEVRPKSSVAGAAEPSIYADLPLASLAYERALELATRKSQKIVASQKKRVLRPPPIQPAASSPKLGDAEPR